MSNQKKFTEEEVKNVGLRIRSCRVLTGLTQEEFGNACGFSVPSIKTWELGSVIPRADGLKKYCESLKSYGLFVNTDWLLYGAGTGPAYFLHQGNSTQEERRKTLDSKVVSIKESFEDNCRKNKENPVFFQIADDEMASFYEPGDFIGGVLIERNNLTNKPQKPMLAKLENGDYLIRFVYLIDDEFFISSIKNPLIQKVKLDAIGAVKLHYAR